MALCPLDRIVTQAVALALGISASLLAPALSMDAPALLVALLVTCLYDLRGAAKGDLLLVGACLLLALWQPFWAFGPLVACLSCASPRRPLRLLWVAPALWGWHFMAPATAFGLGLLSAAAFALSLRCERALAQMQCLTQARDGLREQVMALDEKNSELALEAASQEEAGAQAAALEGLTSREQSILALVAEGLDNKEVAGRLYLSEGTVRNHVSAILRKKQLHNRTQLVSLYFRGPASSL